MAHGKDGVVKVDIAGGNPALIKTTSFNISESAGTARTDSMGDDWESNTPGKKAWSGSFTCRKDSLAAQQVAIGVGMEVDLELYPEGETSGVKSKSGTAVITTEGVDVTMDDTVNVQFDFKGSGPLLTGTVV